MDEIKDMPKWYTAQQLAGLKELPKTDRGVRIQAERDGWWTREKLVGKGLEYHIASLPKAAQNELRRREGLDAARAHTARVEAELQAQRLAKIQSDAEAFAAAEREKDIAEQRARLRRKEDGLAQFAALSDGDKKRRALMRKYLIEIYWEHFRKRGGSREAAREHIAQAVNSGEIAVPFEYLDYLPQYNGTRTLSEATLRRWEADYRNEGIWGLVDKHGHRKGKSEIETTPELYKTVLGCMLKHPHITPKKIKQYLAADFPHLDIVSEKSIGRFKTKWIKENHQEWTYITNHDRWKNVYMAAVGSHHENIERLNQLWEMDSTPADWMLTDGRHSVVGVIDMWSRRLKFRVSKTSSGYAVAQTFRAAALAWGLPEAIRTDNGKDYVSKHFNGVLNDLHIGHELCLPFASEEKGTIERAMRTMSHGILDLLPGFIGHNVAERKQIEARKSFADRIMKSGEVIEVAMSAAELQKQLDDWCEHLYGKDPHSGLAGKSPWQVANSWLQPIRKVENERALDALLAPVDGTRVITAEGITLNHNEYIAAELTPHVGRVASLKLDDADLGRMYVYIDNQFVCIAECPELLGISRRDKAAAIKNEQKKSLRERAAEHKQHMRGISENIAAAVIAHRIEQSENVAELPKRAEEYSTPALEQAARAMQPRVIPQQDADIAAAAAATLNNIIALEPRTLTAHQQIMQRNDACEMFMHWQEMQRRIENGEQVSSEELRWSESFPHSALYRAGEVLAAMRQQMA